MKTIIWDVDDVLNDLMRVWLEQFLLKNKSGLKILYEQIKVNPPHQLLGVSLKEYLASLDDFRLSGSYANLSPNIEVLQWFEANGSKYRHAALTRVPVAVSHISASWVMKHFGQWIRSFHFIPSFREGEDPPIYDENKGTYLNYFGKADILIDDTMENISSVEKFGIKTIIYPRPWNNSNLTVAQTLVEIQNLLKG